MGLSSQMLSSDLGLVYKTTRDSSNFLGCFGRQIQLNFSRKSAHVALNQANLGQEFDKCRWFGFQLIETLSSLFNFRLVLREIQLQRLFLVLVLVIVSPLFGSALPQH